MHLPTFQIFHEGAEKQQYKSNSPYVNSSPLWELNNCF